MVSLALLRELHAPQVMSPTSIQMTSGTHLRRLRTVMMKISWELKILSSGQTPPSPSLEDHVLRIARRDPGAVYRADRRHRVYGEVHVLRQGCPSNTQHLILDVSDYCRTQSYIALAGAVRKCCSRTSTEVAYEAS